MRVAFLTGPVSVGRCGVGDYTRLLAAAIQRKGASAEVIECPRNRLSQAFGLYDATKTFRPDITHVQYPTSGFGKGITPQVFSLLSRFVLTLHEVEGTHLLRRLSLYPLWVRARHVIFTCRSNREYSLRCAPWLRNISSVVPLASNIPVAANGRKSEYKAEVIHFGLVRPNKGIEDVLEFARLATDHQLPFRVSIVGSCPEKHADYLAAMQARSANLPVTWDLNLSSQAVAERLAGAAVAYMPFPDGASERHASILAALENGLPVITTKGKFTPTDLEQVVTFCATPAEAIGAVRGLLQGPEAREVLAGRAIRYAAKSSWESIADSHISIYERVMDSNTRRN